MKLRPSTLALLAVLAAPSLLSAQGLFVDVDRSGRRPTPSGVRGPCLPMTALDFDVRARETQVELTALQTFRNATGRILEGVYLFPLPKGAVAAQFELWMNGQPVPAEVLKKDKARDVYESIVRRVRDPGLLEYVEQDLLRANIFPIQPGQDAKVRVKLVFTPERVGSLLSCDLPLHVPEGSPRLAMKVAVESAQKLGPIFSPTHELDVVRDGDHAARASYEGTVTKDRPRVRLYYGFGGEEPGVSLLSHRSQGAGHFLMTLFSPSLKNQARMPRDVVFVLDRSGSMKDGKLEQAVEALQHGISTLAEVDRFDVVSFATGTRAVFGEFVPASAANKEKARASLSELRASGGTALADALLESLSRPFDQARLAMVVFLTDGEPTIGETVPERILSQAEGTNQRQARVFCFGLGHDVNARLLDLLADGHDGVSDYVQPEEDLELRVSAFFDRVREPVLRDVEISIEGVEAHDIFPRKLSALYAGTAIHLVGQYDLAGTGKVTLKGKTASQDYQKSFELDFPRQCADNESLRPLFASRKVAYLLQQVRKNGLNPELQEEIERLGREYGIVTPWTSALVVEDGEALAARTDGRFRQRLDRAAGATGSAGFLLGRGEEAEAADGARLPPRTGGPGSPGAPTRGGFAGRRAGELEKKAEVQSLDELRRLQAGEQAVRAADALNALAGNAKGKGSSLFGDEHDESATKRRAKDAIAHRDGRTFFNLGGAWVDRSVTAEGWTARRTVVAYSEEYFALLAKHEGLSRVFALSEEVVVTLDGTVVHVIPEEPPPAEDKSSDSPDR